MVQAGRPESRIGFSRLRGVPGTDRATESTYPVERTITLTDAVVAIAMTLLVLPLVDLAPEAASSGWAQFLDEHGSVLLGFVLSFLVVYVFWLVHEQAFATVRQVGPALRALNMLWLLVVAFLPFPTAVVGRQATTTTTPVYIGTMFVLSALSSAITQVCARTGMPSRAAWRTALTWATPAVFAACALVSTADADAGLLGLLVLVLVRAAEVAGPRVLRRAGVRATSDSRSAA